MINQRNIYIGNINYKLIIYIILLVNTINNNNVFYIKYITRNK